MHEQMPFISGFYGISNTKYQVADFQGQAIHYIHHKDQIPQGEYSTLLL